VSTAVLLLSAPDRPGLVHAAASFVLAHRGNVVDAEQHVDTDSGVFFQRIEFETGELGRDVETAFAPVAAEFGFAVDVRYREDRLKLALMASREPHVLSDQLMRFRAGELPADVVAVISNHPDHADLAAFCGVPYHHLPVPPDDVDGKARQEREVLAVLEATGTDLVVMARYMQILTPTLLDPYAGRIINIHHSFLPAFAGARPYHQAHQRGVKLIGATAHYATADLDEGPIIAQDVIPVSHRDSVADLVRHGRDLETVVLARAVRAHLEHRTLVHGAKTIVFA
jgi:formyltetrahydrofolate deformylase